LDCIGRLPLSGGLRNLGIELLRIRQNGLEVLHRAGRAIPDGDFARQGGARLFLLLCASTGPYLSQACLRRINGRLGSHHLSVLEGRVQLHQYGVSLHLLALSRRDPGDLPADLRHEDYLPGLQRPGGNQRARLPTGWRRYHQNDNGRPDCAHGQQEYDGDPLHLSSLL
jgi:hypothetical protein